MNEPVVLSQLSANGKMDVDSTRADELERRSKCYHERLAAETVAHAINEIRVDRNERTRRGHISGLGK